jgi:serine/threonine protein kinase
VKLADFGISKEMESVGIQMKMTMIVGTPNYIAPEVFSMNSYDHKADIW